MTDFYKKLNRGKKSFPKWKEIPITQQLEAKFKLAGARKRYKGVIGPYRMGYDVMKHLIKKALWR